MYIIGSRKMKTIYRHIVGMTLCLSMMLCAISCSEDAGQEPGGGEGTKVRFLLWPRMFDDVTPLTRALPTDFVSYENLNPHVDINHVLIQAYFTQGVEIKSSGIFAFHEEKVGNTMEYSWTSTIPSIKAGNYYLYGFMPAEDAGTVTVSPYHKVGEEDNFKNGATMQITGLNAVTPGDVCVIVGVKKAVNSLTPIEDMGMQLGLFNYLCEASDPESDVYLLLDHLYAGLHLKMSIDEEYEKLRTVKLKSMTLKADQGNQTVATVDATINVVANPYGTDPVGEISFTTATTGTSVPAAIYEGDERELTIEPQEFLACFAPNTNTEFLLETTYNVYDKKGNPIREGCTAKNKIKVIERLQPGQVNTMNIVVKPTYLYVLSEPDIDSPSLVFN